MREEEPHLLQEGSYGCAFTPALPCKKTKSKKSGSRTVGKIIKHEHAEVELSIAAIIQGINDWQSYYIIQEEDNCTTNNFKRLRKVYEKQCKLYKRTENKGLLQLLSPYGGTPLRLYGITQSFSYIRTLRHMLEGVAKLNEQGICHCDLHEGNILVDTNDTFKLIDFGAAFLGDQVTEKVALLHTYSFSPEFPPQPPEFSVQNGIYEGLTISYSSMDTIVKKKVYSKMQGLLGVSIQSQKEELDSFWNSQNEWKGDGKWAPFFKAYWKTIDSWSIGVMFFDLLYKYSFHASVKKEWEQYQLVIRTVLKGCLHSDPRKRFTARQALGVLDAGLSSGKVGGSRTSASASSASSAASSALHANGNYWNDYIGGSHWQRYSLYASPPSPTVSSNLRV
jgi:serine/threonine protein kinase